MELVTDLSVTTHTPYQNLAAGKAVIPCLTIAVHRSFTIDLDVFATPDHEGDALLEGVVEIVVLPIFNIVSELETLCQRASSRSDLSTHLQCTIELDINIVQDREINLLANDVCLSFFEVHKTAVLCLFESPDEVC